MTTKKTSKTIQPVDIARYLADLIEVDGGEHAPIRFGKVHAEYDGTMKIEIPGKRNVFICIDLEEDF